MRPRGTGSERRSAAARTAVVTLRLAAPMAMIAFVWWIADGPEALAHLGAADPVLVGLGLAAANLQIVLSAWRWRLTASGLGLHIEASTAIGEYYLAQWTNQTVPGGVIGDAARAARLRRRVGLARSAQSVIVERLAGQIALFAVTLVALAAALAVPGGLDWPAGVVGTGLVVACAISLTLFLLRRRLRTAISRWPAVVGLSTAVRHGLTAPAVRWRQIALGMAIVGCNLATFALCAAATGTSLPFEAVVTVVPLILSAMLLPASTAGWGWREGAAAALFPLFGATPAAGLAASVCFGVVVLLASLPGVFWLALPSKIGNRA